MRKKAGLRSKEEPIIQVAAVDNGGLISLRPWEEIEGLTEFSS